MRLEALKVSDIAHPELNPVYKAGIVFSSIDIAYQDCLVEPIRLAKDEVCNLQGDIEI